MNRPTYQIGLVAVLAILGLMLLAIVGCSFSTANIKDATTARDYDGTDPTITFAQDEIFYCVVDLANAPDDTTVKASWTAIDVEGADPNTFIDESELTTGSNSLHFQLSNDGLWPVGTYKVDLYLNGELDRTLEFEVK
jgi:hypothetical protein